MFAIQKNKTTDNIQGFWIKYQVTWAPTFFIDRGTYKLLIRQDRRLDLEFEIGH